MRRQKKTVAIICGGKSQEHEVSLQSAYYVFKNINRKKYRVILLGIDKKGNWHYASRYENLIILRKPLGRMRKGLNEVVLIKKDKNVAIFDIKKRKVIDKIDIAFPMIHGTLGEDGCLQGYLELLGLPYVGSGVLGSALGMDKVYSKKLLQMNNISVAPFVVLAKNESLKEQKRKEQGMIKKYGLPLIVKPSSLGSSVGVSKVSTSRELNRAIKIAFHYDNKVLIEKYIKGREIECSVLGNIHLRASLPGEVKPSTKHGFYSYTAKYMDSQGAQLLIPAPLSSSSVKKIQSLSLKVFQTLQLRGLARVDMFLQKNKTLIINEVNTIPGFTQISMYPHLWQVSGMSYQKLLTTLIQLAQKAFINK